MKQERIHSPDLSYIAAFAIGVILFASFGTASGTIALAGVGGVAVAVGLCWLQIELKKTKDKDD